MDHFPNGSRPNRRASGDWFTGTVWQEPIVEAPEPARLRSASVRFEPGARTNWHTHPLGQTLFVTSGLGRAQVWGGPIIELRPGDTVWIPPGEKHWHGAGPDTAMTHVAMHEALDGVHVTGWSRSATPTIWERSRGKSRSGAGVQRTALSSLVFGSRIVSRPRNGSSEHSQ